MSKKKAKAPAPQSGGGAIDFDNRFVASMKRYVRKVKNFQPKIVIILIVIALVALLIASQMF